MRFCSKMDYTINLLILHQFEECIKITNIHLYEFVIRFVFDVLEIGEVAGICKSIKIDNFVFRVFVYKKTYDMTAYKSSTASYYNIFHSCILLIKICLPCSFNFFNYFE